MARRPSADHFDPLIKAGATTATQLLAVADVETARGVAHYLSKFNRQGEKPSSENLQLAAGILRLVEAAIMSGDVRVWAALRRGFERVNVDARYLVIECVSAFLEKRNRWHPNASQELPDDDLSALAERSLAELRDLDLRFKAVTARDFLAALADVKDARFRRGRGQVSAFTACARLMVKSGAFGTTVQVQDGKLERLAVVRVAKELSKAWNQRPKRRTKKDA